MKTIAQLTSEYDAAMALARELRQQRADLIESKSPHQVGAEFEQRGNAYRVRRVTASPHKAEVYLDCHYRIGTGKWSQGSKTVSLPVEG